MLAESGIDAHGIQIDDALFLIELIVSKRLKKNIYELLSSVDKKKYSQYDDVISLVQSLDYSYHLSMLYDSVENDIKSLGK